MDVAPEGWVAVSGNLARFAGRTISFDDDCVIYVGSAGGYVVHDHSTGLTTPSALREPNDQIYSGLDHTMRMRVRVM